MYVNRYKPLNKIEWGNGKTYHYNTYWNDNNSFAMDIGDGELIDKNGDSYFIHCEYNCDCGMWHYIFQIWFEDSNCSIYDIPKENRNEYLTETEIEELRAIIYKLATNKPLFLQQLLKNNGHKLVKHSRCIAGHKYETVFNYSNRHGGTSDSVRYYNKYVIDTTKEYKVKYTDNTGADDSVMIFLTEEEAEKSIKEDLETVKEYCQSLDYDYADFGNKTEFWVSGGDEYACWERLWK